MLKILSIGFYYLIRVKDDGLYLNIYCNVIVILILAIKISLICF